MKKLLQVSIVLLPLLLTNCVTFKSDRYAEIKIEDLQVKTKSDKKIKIYTTWNLYSSIANAAEIHKGKYEHLAMFNDAVREAGCCEIMDTKDGADIIVEGGFRNETNPNVTYFASLTGATFGIIPLFFNAKISISAIASKQKKNYTYDLDDSYSNAMWLPLVLVMPFRESPLKTERRVMERLYKNLVLAMKKDGVLEK